IHLAENAVLKDSGTMEYTLQWATWQVHAVDQFPHLIINGNVQLFHNNVCTESLEFRSHRSCIRIFFASSARQHNVLDPALRHQPLRDFEPERTETSGDEIGSRRLPHRFCRFRQGRPYQARPQSMTSPHAKHVPSTTLPNL